MPEHAAPGVVFQPVTTRKIGRGIAQLTALIGPTLGPSARPVAISVANKPPELLDDGAMIARRLLELPDRSEDVGAMFLRNLLWRVHEQAGDGTATACVMFDAAFREGARYLAAAGNAMRLRDALAAGMGKVLAHLDDMTIHKPGAGRIRQVARSICPDTVIADQIANAYATLGEHALLEIRNDRLDGKTTTYIPGSYWETQVHSRRFLTNTAAQRFDLERAAILSSDLDLNDPVALRAIVDKARGADAGGLLVISNRISDACLTMLLSYQATTGFETIAVRTPFAARTDQMNWLQDFELLTGSRPFYAIAGDWVGNATGQDLGFSRRVWADRRFFGIVCGRTRPAELRARVRNLRRVQDASTDFEARTAMSDRIARLTGAAARIGVTERPAHKSDLNKSLADRTARAVRRSIAGGLIPGGGHAYLAARSSLPSDDASDADYGAARRILIAALEAPYRQIACNAGSKPVLDPEYPNSVPPPVLDSAATLKIAWQVAIEGAAQALTINTIVHRASPEESMVP
jgi:chaperonin GroEL